MNIQLFGGECDGYVVYVPCLPGVLTVFALDGAAISYEIVADMGFAMGGRRPSVRRAYTVYERKNGKWIPLFVASILEEALLWAEFLGDNGCVRPMFQTRFE